MRASRLILAGLTITLGLSAPALALDAKHTVTIPAQPAAVWAAIGQFCGIKEWHPAVADCVVQESKGATLRDITVKGGAKIVERLKFWDREGMRYGYTIVTSPLPVANYRSDIQVEPTADGLGAKVTWKGRFAAKGASDADAVKAITGIYVDGLNALARKLTGG